MTEMDDVKEIIEKSGNNFHCKVIKYLNLKGWTAKVSPYYNDLISGKPREIDLIAEKFFIINDNFGSRLGRISVRLFIECKYIANKTVFWFDDRDQEKSKGMVERTTPCRSDNTYSARHYYYSQKWVAKLFSEEKSRGPENETFYKALNQSLNACIYYRKSPSIIHAPPNRVNDTKYTLNYPVIVCNSFEKLYLVNVDNDDDAKPVTNNFQLEVNYATDPSGNRGVDEYFLIDVLGFQNLDKFLAVVEVDAEVSGFLHLYK